MVAGLAATPLHPPQVPFSLSQQTKRFLGRGWFHAAQLSARLVASRPWLWLCPQASSCGSTPELRWPQMPLGSPRCQRAGGWEPPAPALSLPLPARARGPRTVPRTPTLSRGARRRVQRETTHACCDCGRGAKYERDRCVRQMLGVVWFAYFIILFYFIILVWFGLLYYFILLFYFNFFVLFCFIFFYCMNLFYYFIVLYYFGLVWFILLYFVILYFILFYFIWN